MRDSIGQQPVFHLAENGSPWVRALINRRGFQAREGVAELAGGIFRDAAARYGKGWTLVMSDRFSGKVRPRHPGTASHGKRSWADTNR
ncbi:hypothetical protein RU07_06215 [Agrobacterium tumefaciens]|uniref:Transposase n=1 Tax=Agrobacterium tumefaciens TaxID=358 RepID=A0A0D0KUK1_AGRTU|nr:hypothetical protein RU07_06215 [Agrobacterium tumefaciens]